MALPASGGSSSSSSSTAIVPSENRPAWVPSSSSSKAIAPSENRPAWLSSSAAIVPSENRDGDPDVTVLGFSEDYLAPPPDEGDEGPTVSSGQSSYLITWSDSAGKGKARPKDCTRQQFAELLRDEFDQFANASGKRHPPSPSTPAKTSTSSSTGRSQAPQI